MKHKFNFIFGLMAFSILVLSSCGAQSDDSSSGGNSSLTYYVGGNDGQNPVYWKNGEKIDFYKPMTNEQNYYSILKFFKNGNDIYAAGIKTDKYSKAVYWKNNNLMHLTRENATYIHERALDLFLDGNDLYACGTSYQENSNQSNRAIYWKNGQEHFLTDGLNSGSAYKILSFNNDLYIIGRDGSSCYWKNGQKNYVPYFLEDLKVYNNSVYILGHTTNGEDLTVIIWKDGVETQYTYPELSTFSPKEIFIDNSDMYIAGTQYLPNQIWKAGYLKNGVLTTLTNNTSAQASGIFVKNNNVYVSGQEGVNPMIWINGEPISLPHSNPGGTSNVQIINE